MSCTTCDLGFKKDERGFKLGEDKRIRFQLFGFSLVYIPIVDTEAIPVLSLKYVIYQPQSFPLTLKWSSSVYLDFNEVYIYIYRPS